jgi:hypothetical protein
LPKGDGVVESAMSSMAMICTSAMGPVLFHDRKVGTGSEAKTADAAYGVNPPYARAVDQRPQALDRLATSNKIWNDGRRSQD